MISMGASHDTDDVDSCSSTAAMFGRPHMAIHGGRRGQGRCNAVATRAIGPVWLLDSFGNYLYCDVHGCVRGAQTLKPLHRGLLSPPLQEDLFESAPFVSQRAKCGILKERARSSAGQSECLRSIRSGVRISPGAPFPSFPRHNQSGKGARTGFERGRVSSSAAMVCRQHSWTGVRRCAATAFRCDNLFNFAMGLRPRP